MKLRFKDLKESNFKKVEARRFYENKFYGLFINAFKFPQLNNEQQHYLLKRFWADGSACVKVLGSANTTKTLSNLLGNKGVASVTQEDAEGVLIITPFTTTQWNIYDFPTIVNMVNTRGASFIPNTPQIVNKDVVIGYAHTTHASIRDLVLYYVDKIVDVEQTINTNLFVHKMPRLVVVSPEDKERVKDICERIDNGEHAIFLDALDVDAVKNVLDGGGTYIIDKLYTYKQNLESELLTFLGIDNNAIEKQERMIVDEVNANNDVINNGNACFFDTLKEFCKQVSDILGFTLSVESTLPKVTSVKEKNKTKEEVQDNVNNE